VGLTSQIRGRERSMFRFECGTRSNGINYYYGGVAVSLCSSTCALQPLRKSASRPNQRAKRVQTRRGCTTLHTLQGDMQSDSRTMGRERFAYGYDRRLPCFAHLHKNSASFPVVRSFRSRFVGRNPYRRWRATSPQRIRFGISQAIDGTWEGAINLLLAC
jgi:hypothetical protein